MNNIAICKQKKIYCVVLHLEGEIGIFFLPGKKINKKKRTEWFRAGPRTRARAVVRTQSSEQGIFLH